MRLGWFVLVCVVASPVYAAGPEDDAKDLFVRGREARTRGDCVSAVPLFEKAFRLFPKGLGSARNLAECHESLGHWASARRAWLELARALLTIDDAKYTGWAADAKAADDRLAPKVPHLSLVIHGHGVKTAVRVNGEALDDKLVAVPLERDPGTYVVRVEGGRAPLEQTVTLATAESKTLTFEVEAPVAATPTPLPAPSSAKRTLGFVALGVGSVSLIGAGVSLLLRQGAMRDLRDACPAYERGPCPESARAIVDRGATASTAATIFSAVAIVGIGTGVTLVMVGKKSEPSAAVTLLPGGAALTGTF